MPSWSSRFGLPSTSSGSSRSGRRHSPSRQEAQRMLTPQLDDESMPSQPARHNRSRSFNFLASTDSSEPILINGREPSTRKGISDGDLKATMRISRSYESSSIKPLENQMASGNCCCCDLRVQWPAHLSVYRCTTCLTINDLAPLPQDGKQSLVPISLDSLKALLSCVRSDFIQSIKGLGYLPSEGLVILPEVLTEKGFTPQMNPQIIISTESSGGTSEKRGDNAGTVDTLPLTVHSANEGEDTSVDANEARRKRQREITSKMFTSLDEHIMRSFSSWECLNGSFRESRPEDGGCIARHRSGSTSRSVDLRKLNSSGENSYIKPTPLPGEYEERLLRRQAGTRRVSVSKEKERGSEKPKTVSLKNSNINFKEMDEYYHELLTLGDGYVEEIMDELEANENFTGKERGQYIDMEELRSDIEEARAQTLRILLKATEALLKRPGRPIKRAEDTRFLLIVLGNPLLYGAHNILTRTRRDSTAMTKQESKRPMPRRQSTKSDGNNSGNHSTITKRILGLIGFLPNECHHYLVSWFARFPDDRLKKVVDLCNSFVTHRLAKQYEKKRDVTDNSASNAPGRKKKREKGVIYDDDWQIKAAAKVMAILFAANNSTSARRHLDKSINFQNEDVSDLSIALQAKYDASRRGQLIATSDFYNSMLDYADLIADFDAWESRSPRFCFCQYPFFFSIGSKIHILEYDARRQMELKAREAFFSSISTKRSINQYMILKIRRECLVEDSLKGISEGVGSVDEIKKGLRIEFLGEDGIDGGGLRKEWFLLLVRDVFDPNNGMFTYDEDSGYCYFNPHSLESTEDFFLIGVVFGLAIYNSTILDVALPPFLFKKLLHGANHSTAPSFARTPLVYTLDDLAIYRPQLAAGLKELLEFKGDVQETFCRDFVATVERFGVTTEVPLCPDGDRKPVTNANRREFVDLYIRYIIDTSVARQFEPFKRGFFTVCAGNALSLFRPEEIELLVRGSAEPLDITSLQAVAVYENWHSKRPENEPLVQWFWEFFASITPKEQRMLLSFITGSDRIPATGATNLVIKIACMGQDLNNRFPIARTCFNQICLWRYKTKEKFTSMLWRAVVDSQGFGLK